MAKDVDDEIEVEEEAEGEEVGTHVEFDIATYPSDLTLSVIYDMWKDKDITIPVVPAQFRLEHQAIKPAHRKLPARPTCAAGVLLHRQ